MNTVHLVLRYSHISMGALALLSGAAAMILRKGAPWHRQTGNVFFVSMLTMAGTGTIISIFITPEMGNVMGGTMTCYMVATAWATVIRRPGEIGRFEVVAALAALALSVTNFVFGVQAVRSPDGQIHGFRPIFYFVMGGAALLAASLDARMIARGGFVGVSRTTRHLSRMCIAMFMATASFFLGQARLFPMAVRKSGVLSIPVLLVVGALLYWLVRIKLLPAVRASWAARRTRLAAVRPTAHPGT